MKEDWMFKGSLVAIITPFKDGRIDQKRFKDLIEFQIKNGTSGIVPCGTTGESATLSLEEHEQVVDITVQTVAGRVPVIAGAGSNNTAEAVRLVEHAKKAKADGVLLISPYYNKPTQRGLYLHFKAVAEAVDIPIVLYNVPSRTGVNVEPNTVAELSRIKNIVAIKEASANADQMAQIKRLCGENITLLSGDDAFIFTVLALGGTGVISVVANIMPAETSQIFAQFAAGDIAASRRSFFRLLPLTKAMFIETNPIPVKTALGLMGKISPEFRLPLCPMLPANEARLKKILKEYRLI
jgi:4-hydroxy-tetrahydrodipicolinate synthase